MVTRGHDCGRQGWTRDPTPDRYPQVGGPVEGRGLLARRGFPESVVRSPARPPPDRGPTIGPSVGGRAGGTSVGNPSRSVAPGKRGP